MRLFLLSLFLLQTARAEVAPKSVYDIDLTTDLIVLGSSLAVGTIPYVFEQNWISRRCPCLITEVNEFDRPVIGNHSNTALVLSDILVASAVLAPVVFNYTQLGFSDAFWEDTLVFAEAIAVSSALVSATKLAFQRPVPRAYEGDPAYLNSPQGYRSFYSGHTTTAATAISAAAMNLILRYDQSTWPWLGAAGVTAAVAALRVAGGVHFYSDVVVGALVGTTIGILVPLLHKKKQFPTAGRWRVLPLPQGAQFSWSLAL